jgi:succinyl-CoA synthetase alpha subunit
MSILVDKNTKVITQGMTGATGTFHTEQALAYGTQMVGGVTPGKGGTSHIGLPVFDTVDEAVAATGATASVVYVPPPFAADSILEAIDAEVPLIVCITEGIPVLDMVRVKRALSGSKSRLIGPNCPGVLTPNECKIGIMPGSIFKKGSVGVVSRSGTLTYEAVFQTIERRPWPDHGGRHRRRSGQRHQFHRRARAVPCRRGDQVDHHDRRNRRRRRGAGRTVPDRRGQEAAARSRWPASSRAARRLPGRRMGHAGAIVSGGKGDAESKIAAMEAAGIKVAASPSELGTTLLEVLKG